MFRVVDLIDDSVKSCIYSLYIVGDNFVYVGFVGSLIIVVDGVKVVGCVCVMD